MISQHEEAIRDLYLLHWLWWREPLPSVSGWLFGVNTLSQFANSEQMTLNSNILQKPTTPKTRNGTGPNQRLMRCPKSRVQRRCCRLSIYSTLYESETEKAATNNSAKEEAIYLHEGNFTNFILFFGGFICQQSAHCFVLSKINSVRSVNLLCTS